MYIPMQHLDDIVRKKNKLTHEGNCNDFMKELSPVSSLPAVRVFG